jgi:sRNA-binding protein
MPRQVIEGHIECLSAKYPKCFFVDPRMRQPLKKNIVADLEKDRVLDDEKRAAAVTFYTNDWAYQRALQAGVERVDLNGDKAGIVTELEQRTAEKKIQQDKKKLAEKNIDDPIAVLSQLHAAGRIPTDSLGKLTAPKIVTPMKKPEPPPPATPKPAPTLERLQTLMTSLQEIDTQDEGLKAALTTATLGVIVAEAQKLIDSLGRNPCS